MADLSTTYMGLKLSNPLIVASCSLTKTEEGVRRCADAGAGAVVLKSLFEEQIEIESREIKDYLWMSAHSEAFDYVNNMSMEIGPRDYLKLIEKSKKLVSIPIIASLNCVSPKWWTGYARQIEAAGADAIELNISIMPCDPEHTGQKIEEIYLLILQEVKNQVRIPIAIKIGSHFTSIAHFAKKLSDAGAAALVLFNRFYQMDIDVEKMELIAGHRFSSPEEMSMSLRWMAILSGKVNCDLAASTGIHDGKAVIKQILAGATVVQLCSTLYLHEIKQISLIRSEIEEWMEKHKIDSLPNIRGKLSQTQSHRPEIYERLQYIQALVGID